MAGFHCSGKQNDHEVETCINCIHLMQMYMFVDQRGIAEVKIFLPARPFPDTGLPQAFAIFFFKCTTALWSGK